MNSSVKTGQAFPSVPSPIPFLSSFCSRPNFRAAQMQKIVRLLRERLLKPGFHMSGKSQTVSRPSQILPTNENSKSYISPIVWDERGQIWRIGSVSIFPTRPRFLRWSAIIPDKCTVGDVGVLRRWISLITNHLNCWAPVPLSQINVSFLENLGQTSGEYLIYRQNLGWSAKSIIPDRLRFFPTCENQA